MGHRVPAMTVYVDSMGIPATVGRYTSLWYHLMSDQLDPAELHEFASRIGMRRFWFQPGKSMVTRSADPVGDHYDVTHNKREEAIKAGAVVLDRDGFIGLMKKRREVARIAR